jgi:hypothetical protein
MVTSDLYSLHRHQFSAKSFQFATVCPEDEVWVIARRKAGYVDALLVQAHQQIALKPY